MQIDMEDLNPQACYFIECIGVDNLRHICLPWDTHSPCGVKIKSKKVNSIDKLVHFCCVECDYMDAPFKEKL